MTYFIDDPRKWRLSKSGCSIKTGWADEQKIIAKYPGTLSPMDTKQFQEWVDNVEHICELHNATLPPNATELTGSPLAASPATGGSDVE